MNPTPMIIDSALDNFFWAGFNNVAKPAIDEVLDKSIPMTAEDKDNWGKQAARETLSYIIQMMANTGYMALLQRLDKFYEILYKLYLRLKRAILSALSSVRDFVKNRIKGKRGVVAKTLFENYGKGQDNHIEMQKLQAMELSNQISSRASTIQAVQVYEPASRSVNYSAHERSFYTDLAYKQGRLMLDSFAPKAMMGAFGQGDVAQVKKMTAPNGGGTQGVTVQKLNDLQGIYMTQDSSGDWIGNAKLQFQLLNHMGYLSFRKGQL